MKRIAYMLMCLCVLLTATACGDGVGESSTPADQPTYSTTTTNGSSDGADIPTIPTTDTAVPTNGTTTLNLTVDGTTTTTTELSNDVTLDFGDDASTTVADGKSTTGTTTQPTVRPADTTTTTTATTATTTTTIPPEGSTPQEPTRQVDLPEDGYKLDSTGRISLKSASVNGNVVTFVMQNTSGTWMPGEDSALTYTVYDKNGQVVLTGELIVGMIKCRKTANITLTLPADAARVTFGNFAVEYWSDWKK